MSSGWRTAAPPRSRLIHGARRSASAARAHAWWKCDHAGASRRLGTRDRPDRFPGARALEARRDAALDAGLAPPITNTAMGRADRRYAASRAQLVAGHQAAEGKNWEDQDRHRARHQGLRRAVSCSLGDWSATSTWSAFRSPRPTVPAVRFNCGAPGFTSRVKLESDIGRASSTWCAMEVALSGR
jgi:hypothetical protein